MKFILVLFLLTPLFSSQSKNSGDVCVGVKDGQPVIDKNACPGEGCQLGTWTAKEAIPVLDNPDGKKEILKIKLEEKFQAIYGENHVTPSKIEVVKEPTKDDVSNVPAKLKFKKGDTFYLVTNQGEAWFSACANGLGFQVECTGISNMESTCTPNPTGTWSKSLNGKGPTEKWWVKIKTSKGISGWIQGHRYQVTGSDAFE